MGIDEFGNFLNSEDNTSTGANSPGANVKTPGSIALRGAGSINWVTLNRDNKTKAYYPDIAASQKHKGIEATCKTGRLHKYNGTTAHNGKWINTGIPILNYPLLAYTVLPSSSPIGNNATIRANARPISYKLRITPKGLLSLWWSYNGGVYQPILLDRNIIATNGPLPEKFRFGFVASTGGSTNNHELVCFKAAPASKSDNSAAISLPDGEYKTDSQIYISIYNPNNWWSSLVSQNMLYHETLGTITINPVANWDASCVLTGGVCNKTGGDTVTVQAPSDRTIITYDDDPSDKKGIPFKWGDFSSTQKGYLNAVDNEGPLRLQYLRGDRTHEFTTSGAGKFRARTSVLGDIINSGPAWVGPPTKYDKTVWADKLTSATMSENDSGVQTYAEFKSLYNDRLNVLYVGANDGFLHGLRSGAYDSTGKIYQKDLTDKPNDGKEVLAYMPATVLKKIHNTSVDPVTGITSINEGLDFSNKGYAHNYFNDATPGTGDLFYGGKWHTWLVSGLGAGGAAIYALDVTDPTGAVATGNKFTESNANKLVIGEWSYKATDPIWQHLGNTHGTPEIRRFHNGQWGAVFGNGWCDANDAANGNCSSPTGKAGIYVMLADRTTGVPEFRFLDTGVGSAASPNGIAYVTPVDLDEDQIVDYVYAGDIQGNVWRFDLTDTNPSTWGSSSSRTQLFSTGNGQPITTSLSINYDKRQQNATPRLMVSFGTGKKTGGYLVSEDAYAAKTQSMYGVWDWNISSWNAKSARKYASQASGSVVTKSKLTAQTVNATTNAMSNNEVCWADNISCAATPQFGWYLNFAAPEQVVYNPVVSDETNAIIVNTYSPGQNETVSCQEAPSSGFTYAFDLTSGKGKPGFWSGNFYEPGYRLPLGATGSPSLMKVKDKLMMLTKDAKGEPIATEIFIPLKAQVVRRLSWRIIN